MKRRYEQEFGRSTPSTSPMPSQHARAAAPKSKLPLYLLLAFGVLMGGAWVVIKYVLPDKSIPVEKVPEKKDPNAGLTKEAANQKIMEILGKVPALISAGDLAGADQATTEARQVALAAGIPVPAELDKTVSEVEFEKQYRAKFEKALRRFCVEDYSTANIVFSELEQAKPSDTEPGLYIQRIYYNLGISELQKKQPWEASFYFESLKGDPEACEVRMVRVHRLRRLDRRRLRRSADGTWEEIEKAPN